MNPSALLQWLQQALEQSDGSEPRHIIRLASKRQYSEFERLLRRKTTAVPKLTQVLPLPLIQAFSCPLRTTASKTLTAAACVRSVETDPRIRIQLRVAQPRLQLRTIEGSSAASVPVIPWGIRHIGAPRVWPRTKGARIRIGVIDTGADYNHPDLRHCLSRGVNLLEPHKLPYDDNGHGTHIAGTISATARHRGLIGVAPLAAIYPVKAFDNQGGAYVSDIVKGIDWCVANGMDIINMSFGMKTYSKALESAVLNAYERGVIIVASSGNEGKRAEVDYPARLPQVIAVGATNRQGRIAVFSNDGKQIDIYAPGERVYSTWLNGKYHELSGTSMATSHVSGVVALMLALKPALRPGRIRSLLRKHARLIPRPGRKKSIRELHAYRTIKGLLRRSSK
ncbi:S8 family peptidase [Paenibacillus sp. YYML68]|uniref:S8 family peptidase n=1 Tax=Paenibacillus sp. YYML68 TaxID=2909250 RepID=UPI00249366B6|nr:S8 family peptidase [Paenibacillus sp. YYML68]